MHRILAGICGPSRARIGLRDQIALLGISGVIVTGVICAAALHYASLVQKEATGSDRFKSDVASLSQSFLESRQIASEFLRKPGEALIKKYAQNHERQLADLARVESFAMGLPDDDPLRQAASLRPVINLYATRFQNVVAAQRNLGFSEDEGFQGKLRNDVHAVEQRLSELNETRLTILMLMMRRHEKDFILRGDDRYGDQLAEREAEFETVLAQDSIPQEIKAGMLERIRAYKNSFVSFAATQQVLHDQIDDLAQIYDRIRPTLVQVLAAADAHSEAVETRAEQIRQDLIWVICFATVLVGLLALVFGRRIATTIGSMTAAMQQLGEGRFDVVLPGLGRKDELGEMAEAIEMFKLKTREKALAELDAKAEQDRAAAAQRRADIAQLAGEFEAAVGKVIDSVSSASSELAASARSLTCTADHSRRLSAEVASSSEEASSNVRRVAAATSDMAESTANICRRVEEASNMAHEAVHKVELSDRRMASLADAAERIGSVIEVIAAVARQINLLALNATIEAARAGDFGKGFAVVAQEVKALARQAAHATGEISDQIRGIQIATTDTVGAVTEVGVLIGRISEIARTVLEAIGEQETTSKTIALNVQGAAARTAEVATSAREVTKGANETGGASTQVLMSAELLSEESSRLKHELDSFLSRMDVA